MAVVILHVYKIWNWFFKILFAKINFSVIYRGADMSLARRGRKQANVSVRMAWISFGALPCRGKKNLITARVSMLLKSCASLTCFRACFLPGRAKDFSAPQYTREWVSVLFYAADEGSMVCRNVCLCLPIYTALLGIFWKCFDFHWLTLHGQ